MALNLNFSFAPDDYPHTAMTGSSSSHSSVLLRRIFDPLASAAPCAPRDAAAACIVLPRIAGAAVIYPWHKAIVPPGT